VSIPKVPLTMVGCVGFRCTPAGPEIKRAQERDSHVLYGGLGVPRFTGLSAKKKESQRGNQNVEKPRNVGVKKQATFISGRRCGIAEKWKNPQK